MTDNISDIIDKFKIKQTRKIYDKITKITTDKLHKVSLTIHQPPVQTQRPRATAYGHFYVPNAAKNKKNIRKEVAEQIDLSTFKLIQGMVILKIKFYIPIPKSFSLTDKILAEAKYIRPTVVPDIDNYMKTYMDALTDVVWLDDGQVVESHAYKYYSIKPRVHITILYSTDTYCSVLNTYAKNKSINHEMKG